MTDEEYRASLTTDPRFAAWVAIDDPAERERLAEERRELLRIAAQRVIDDTASGLRDDPHALAWAQHTVRMIKPLGRPLGTGEPRTPEHLPLSAPLKEPQ